MSEFTIEVYQPRRSGQYLKENRRDVKPGFEDIFHDLRDLKAGMVDADDIDHDDFTRLYTLAGGDTIEAADEQAALTHAFEQWNNGSGRESEAFRQANDEHRSVSMSSGDIVRVDGQAFFCAPVGWVEVEF